jgi:hypothetical protein
MTNGGRINAAKSALQIPEAAGRIPKNGADFRSTRAELRLAGKKAG